MPLCRLSFLTTLLVVFFAVVPGRAFAAPSSCPQLLGSLKLPESTSKRIQAKINELKDKYAVPGISVSFTNTLDTKGNGLSLNSMEFTAGVQSLEPMGQPVKSSSTVSIASVSKMFTAIAVFQLVEKGILKLDEPIERYTNSLVHRAMSKTPSGREFLSKVTIGHLLSHQSGIMQDLPGTDLWWNIEPYENGSYPGIDEFINNASQIELLFEPGQIPNGMKYSNIGFNLLALLVEAYGGQESFEEYVTKNIIQPLGMENTSYTVNLSSRSYMTPHSNPGSTWGSGDEKRVPLPIVTSPGFYAGSIGINSTPHDLNLLSGVFLRFFSQTGESSILSDSSLSQMVNPVSFQKKDLSWGHGLILTQLNGYVAIGHGGTGYGSRAVSYVFPELGWAFSATFNGRDANREETLLEVMKILKEEGVIYEVPLTDATSKVLKQIREFQQKTKTPPKPAFQIAPFEDSAKGLREYAGVYNSEIVGKQLIQISDKGNLVMWGDELVRDEIDKDVFHFPLTTHPYANGEPVRFLRDRSGKVVSMNALYVLWVNKKQDGY